MKCIPDWKCISPKQINIMISSKNNGFGNAIYLQIPRLKNPIPFSLYFVLSMLLVIKIFVIKLS